MFCRVCMGGNTCVSCLLSRILSPFGNGSTIKKMNLLIRSKLFPFIDKRLKNVFDKSCLPYKCSHSPSTVFGTNSGVLKKQKGGSIMGRFFTCAGFQSRFFKLKDHPIHLTILTGFRFWCCFFSLKSRR